MRNSFSTGMAEKGRGFSLIELILVIVILGILSATAWPYFSNFQKDARIAAIQGIKSAVHSACTMAYSKSVIAKNEKDENAGICLEGTALMNCDENAQVLLTYGRPKALKRGIVDAIFMQAVKYSDTNQQQSSTNMNWTYKELEDGRIAIYQSNLPEMTGVSLKNDGSVMATTGCGIVYSEPRKKDTEDPAVNDNEKIEDYRIDIIDVDC